MLSKEQWVEAKRLFVEGEASPEGQTWPTLSDIARKLGVDKAAVCRRAKKERWHELQRLCRLEVNRRVNESINELTEPAGMNVAVLNLDAYDVARLGQARVKAMLGRDLKSRDLRDLAEAAKSFLQTGRLAMGQSTDHIETDLTQALLEAFGRRVRDGGQG